MKIRELVQEDRLDEFLPALAGAAGALARGAAAVGGGLARGASAVGRSAATVGRAAGNAAGKLAQQVGKAPGQQNLKAANADQEQKDIQKNLSTIKSQVPGLNVNKVTQALTKADTGQKLTGPDKDATTQLSPSMAHLVRDPQILQQFKQLLDKSQTKEKQRQAQLAVQQVQQQQQAQAQQANQQGQQGQAPNTGY
jgi:hypothetical protein